MQTNQKKRDKRKAIPPTVTGGKPRRVAHSEEEEVDP